MPSHYEGPLEPTVGSVLSTPVNERGVWRSAFDTENDIVALTKINELLSYQDDPDFNLAEYAKNDPLFEQDPERFLGVTNTDEYDATRILYQEALLSRETLAKGGFNALAATLVAGIASPTIVIPGGAAVKGLRAGRAAARLAGTSALGGATAVSIQEGILQAAPNDRSVAESLTNVGFGTLLAGTLGGGIGAIAARSGNPPVRIPEDSHVYVPNEAPSALPSAAKFGTPDEIKTRISDIEEQIAGGNTSSELAEELEDLVNAPINPTDTNEALIGATGDIKLDNTLGLANTIGRMSPTVRGYINEYSNTVRDTMRRLDSGGLLFKGEDGGFVADSDVATRAKNWEGVYYKANLRKSNLIKGYHLENRRAVDKLSSAEIVEQASDAIDGGLDNFIGPDIVKQVALAYQEEVFIPFAEEAKRLGFTDVEHWRDPTTYVPHTIRKTMIAADHEDFVQVLSEHFAEKLTKGVSRRIEQLSARSARREEEAADILRTPEEAAELRSELQVLRQEINDGLKPDSVKELERAEALKKQAKTAEPDQAKALRKQARELERSNKELRDRYKTLSGVSRRERNLDKGVLGVQQRIQDKIGQIRKAENQNLRTLNTLVVRAGSILNRIGRAQDSRVKVKDLNKFEEDVDKLLTTIDGFIKKNPDYAALARDATTREGKVISAALIEGMRGGRNIKHFRTPAKVIKERGTVRGLITRARKVGKATEELEARETLLTDELTGLEDDFSVLAENLNPINLFESTLGRKTEFVGRLNAKLLDLNEARGGIVHRRAIRIDKLQKQKDALDPEAPVRQAAALRERIRADTERTHALLEEKGVVFGKGKFDITALARKQADVVAAKFSGETGRVPLISTLLERGPELERTLDIDPLRVWGNGRRYADFMERDLDVLSRLYTRTVGSDFEVYRTFGSLSPFGRASDGVNKTGLLARIQQDFEDARTAAMEKYKDNPKRLEREQNRITKSRRKADRDIQAVVDRIRHLRGIPEDPSSVTYRAGRALLNLNTLRLMGGVVVASLADPARLLIKQGFNSTHRDGFRILFNNMKAIPAFRRELKSAAVGLDMLTHGRLAAISDVFDDLSPGTRAERGLQFATNNMGRIALFDVWNSFWKQTAGVMTMQRLVHDIENVVRQVDNVAGAERFLAHAGIGDDMADRIWKQLTEVPGGADRIKGVLVPNTAEWVDLEAAREFRASLLRVVDDTIVTPGTERPLLMDGTMSGRLVFQFRSFAFASLTKTLMFGAQELKHGNMNIPVGVAMSMGLGALSWYTWANLAGEKQRKRMQKADLNKWIDEALNRSGLLGPMQEFLNVAQKFPALAPYTALSGEASTRSYSPYRNPIIDAFGPTVGLMRDVQTVLGTADEPREITLKAGARLLPFQNLFYARPFIEGSKAATIDALGLK